VALIPRFFSDCVVAIGANDGPGKPYWIASGFLYGYHLADMEDGVKQYRVFLVSNRYVFRGMPKAWLRLNPQGGEEAREFEIPLVDADGSPKWFSHPNSEIDIGILTINVLFLQSHTINFNFSRSDEHVANVQKMSELGTTEGDFAYALGFPMWLVGDRRNTVIVRSGSIARVRDTLANPSQEFLIDAFIVPGNSGGPVVLKPEPIALEGTRPQTHTYLIGVVVGYIPYEHLAVSKQTGRQRVVFQENSGLAAVHTVDCVEETIQVALQAD